MIAGIFQPKELNGEFFNLVSGRNCIIFVDSVAGENQTVQLDGKIVELHGNTLSMIEAKNLKGKKNIKRNGSQTRQTSDYPTLDIRTNEITAMYVEEPATGCVILCDLSKINQNNLN